MFSQEGGSPRRRDRRVGANHVRELSSVGKQEEALDWLAKDIGPEVVRKLDTANGEYSAARSAQRREWRKNKLALISTGCNSNLRACTQGWPRNA